MRKQEFIDELRAALNGSIPSVQMEDTIRYYQDYINVEMRKGKTETEVMDLLGDPRLIAHTIIETSGQAEPVYGGEEADDRRQEAQFAFENVPKFFRLPGWLLAIIVFLVVLLVLGIVFSILSFLMPILLVLIAVFFAVKIFRDWLN